MKKAIFSVLWMVLVASNAEAGSADFEDIPSGTAFSAGETFVSSSFRFEALDTGDPGGVAQVVSGVDESGLNLAGGTGNLLGIHDFGISFLLAPETRQVSMLIGVYSTLSVTVNGLPAPTTGNGAFPIHGSTIDEVTLLVNPVDGSRHLGELVLNGPIQSLIIGGSELLIDNVISIVPEPSSAALLLFAFLCGAGRLRRRRVA